MYIFLQFTHWFTKFLIGFFLLLSCANSRNTTLLKKNQIQHITFPIESAHHQPFFRAKATNGIGSPIELKLLVDTGSNTSIINKKIFKTNAPEKILTIKSLNKKIEAKISEILVQFYYLDKIFDNSLFNTVDFNSSISFDVLLGNDWLSKYHVLIRFPDEISFIDKSVSIQSLVQGFEKLPFENYKNHILIPVSFGKDLSPKNFLFDTGSGMCYINQGEILNQKVHREVSYFDISGTKVPANTYKVDNFCLHKNLCMNDIELLEGKPLTSFLSNNYTKKISGLVGVNWLSEHIVLIDYDKKYLYIQKKLP